METDKNDETLECETEERKLMEYCSTDQNIKQIKNEKTFDYVSSDSFKGTNIDSTTDSIFKKPVVSIDPPRSRFESKHFKTSISSTDEKELPFPYLEPSWGEKPERTYTFEVLKSGVIVETISLREQSFHVIGRLPSCHVSLAHPTVSRHHAVLQYGKKDDNQDSKGLYVYDLGSTHGTFWNGSRIKPNVYVRVRGGHMLKFGCSQRKFILQAPLDDVEEESPYTVSELKEIRMLELEKQQFNTNVGASNPDNENDGIDWGMGEDANEETDTQENPYACIGDEDLVLDDPKKTLRGWYEREGYDLQYKTEEKGPGRFLCWVDLPMEDVIGRSLKVEALVKGKKKEAVVQCALEACKILDKYGLLRQSHHEARKRKTRNWEAEDYYDSDEDNFLDRTGSIEKKREQRMRLAGKLEEKVETYDTLLGKHATIIKRISYLTDSIKNWQRDNHNKREIPEEDALDAFMSNLNSSTLSRSDIAKMKLELQSLRKEETDIIKLLNLTRPANLPALVQKNITDIVTNPVKADANTLQEISKASKIQRSVLQRRKQKKSDGRSSNKSNDRLISRDDTIRENMEAESEEESDTEDTNKNESPQPLVSTVTATTTITNDNDNKKLAIVNATLTQESTSTIDVNEFTRNSEKRKNETKTELMRNNRQMRKKVVSCDQDIYAENYSMWIPPQGQKGDGKTSLNEKYGY